MAKRVLVDTFVDKGDFSRYLERLYARTDIKILEIQFSTGVKSSNVVDHGTTFYSCMITYEEVTKDEE